MGQTIIEKIFAARTSDPVEPGRIIWLELDARTARDFGGANVVKHLEREYADDPVADPAKTFFTFDCVVPANTIPYANNQQICRDFARKHDVRLYDVDMGIGSHVVIEKGLVVPGTTLVGTDSHLNILGAVGAFGQGMGDQDIAFTFKTGKTWFEVPPTLRVTVKGRLEPPLTPKDLNLAILGQIGSTGGLGYSMEFYGEVIEEMGIAGRITLASQATEMGAVIAMLPPNRDVLDYCRERSGREIEPILADDNAEYVKNLEIDITNLKPMVSRPGAPHDVVEAGAVKGVRVDSVFFGSCTNGRLEDLEVAASILRGKRVAPHVMAKVVPATREVYGDLLKKGLLDVFYEAGVIVSNPGCGGCASGQIGMTGKGEVQVSTSNRNFRGKQGAGDTYLAGPAVAAVSALAGEITSP
ncbi:MAG: 3-isopropylmalate dehydratase large subunit [Candidatus Eisenbacteria sp.]|nr:3-isopropylmalate dehydratase large subunit [Candidatus Eisenbacteria bacterium]